MDADRVLVLMKRCQVGVGGHHALDDAHSIIAECYGVLGALSKENEVLRTALILVRRHVIGACQFEDARGDLAAVDAALGLFL